MKPSLRIWTANAVVASLVLVGCAALQASPIPADTQALETCVANQLISGATDPVAIGLACSVQAGTDILALVEFLAQQLESKGKVPAGTSAKVKGHA